MHSISDFKHLSGHSIALSFILRPSPQAPWSLAAVWLALQGRRESKQLVELRYRVRGDYQKLLSSDWYPRHIVHPAVL